MSNPEHEQIIQHGYAVAEAMDVPGFVNTFTPDGTFTDEAFVNVFTGPKELVIMLQVFGSAFPDMHRELHRFYYAFRVGPGSFGPIEFGEPVLWLRRQHQASEGRQGRGAPLPRSAGRNP